MLPGREEPAPPGIPIKDRSFTTTHWSVVLATRDSEPERARQALERLCATYWYPIYACVRRYGRSHDDAEDLTQGFFERLLCREVFQRLEPTGGRMRSYLWVALRRYLHDVAEKEHAQKRVGNRKWVSLDRLSACARYRSEPVDRWNPEQLFERRWAVALLESALQRLKTEASVAKHGHLFEELKGLIQGEKGGRSYAELGEMLGMSAGSVAVTVMRLRRRFAQFCREEVAHTVLDPAEIADELRYLLRVLGQ
jgi:RNA polymerase sigma-70 factor (ECF subfamily)